MVLSMTSVVRACRMTNGGGGAVVLGFSLLIYFYSADAVRAQCVDYETVRTERVIGELQLDGNGITIECVTIAGNLAFVGGAQDVPDEYYGFMRVIDITDPGHVEMRAWVDVPSVVTDIAISGDYAYVTAGSSLLVYDIRHPWNAIRRNVIGLPAVAGGIVIVGSHAYVADGEAGVLSFDIANPAIPQLVGWVNTFGYVDTNEDGIPDEYTLGHFRDVASSGGYVYATSSIGFAVIDVTVPPAPAIVDRIGATEMDGRLSISGSHACVAAGEDLQLIDITDPLSPQLANSLEALDEFCDVAFVGGLAFVADARAGLQVIDMATTTNPRQLWLPMPGRAQVVALSEDVAYVADADILRMVDISESGSLPLVSTATVAGHARRVAVSGDYAYLAGSGALTVVDISDSASPLQVGQVFGNGDPEGIAAFGNLVCVATGGDGLRVFDVADPAGPQQVGHVPHP